MISAISPVTSYRVQAIYGNPYSTKPVSAIKDGDETNTALMTVSREKEAVQSKESLRSGTSEDSVRELPPTRSVATGGTADIVRRISQMQQQKAQDTLYQDDEQPISDTAFMRTAFETDFLRMGVAQNIRDMVSTQREPLSDITDSNEDGGFEIPEAKDIVVVQAANASENANDGSSYEDNRKHQVSDPMELETMDIAS